MEPEGSGGPQLDFALSSGVVCDLGGYFPSLGSSVAAWNRSHDLGVMSVPLTCHYPLTTCLQSLPAV